MSLFSFQGKVWLAERDANGNAQKMAWVGNAPTLTVQLQTESSSKTESYSGNRMQVGSLSKGKSAKGSLVLDEWTLSNLALGLYGTVIDADADAVTDEALPTGCVVGDVVRLDKGFVSDVVMTMATTPTPTTLVENTNYRITSAEAGLIEWLVAPTHAVTADYDHAAVEGITMFTAAPPVRWLLLDGINTENNERVLVDLYKVKFDPVGDLSLITDDYGNITLPFVVLFDPLHSSDANLGGYGRILNKQAA